MTDRFADAAWTISWLSRARQHIDKFHHGELRLDGETKCRVDTWAMASVATFW